MKNRKHSRGEGEGRAARAGGPSQEMMDARRIYEELNSDEAKAVFACKWTQLVADDFNRNWRMLYEMLDIIRRTEPYRNAENVKGMGVGVCASFEEFFTKVVRQPFERWAELEKTYRIVATYCPDLLAVPYAEARKELEANPGVKQGGDRRSKAAESSPTVGLDSQAERARKNGVSVDTQHMIDRLARDRPDLLARVNAGELKVKTAARQAGIVKDLTPVEKVWKLIEKMTAAERKKIRKMLDDL